MWILDNIKPLGAALVTALLAWLLHSLSMGFTEAAHQRQLDEQKISLLTACEADKKLTQEVSNAYQSKISSLNSQLTRLRNVQPARCVPVTQPSGGYHATPQSGKPTRPNGGVDSSALYDFAGEAERYRLQLIGCQDFILKTWESH